LLLLLVLLVLIHAKGMIDVEVSEYETTFISL